MDQGYQQPMTEGEAANRNWQYEAMELEEKNRQLDQAMVFAVVTIDRMIERADRMLNAIAVMKIDGWLDDEYDLADQQDLTKSALEYLEYRTELRVGDPDKETEVLDDDC